MSDLKNQTTEQETKFEQKTDWLVYSGSYDDLSGNRWRIDVSGHAKAVLPFVERKPYSLIVKSADKADAALYSPVEQEEPDFDGEAPLLPALDVTFMLEGLADGLTPPYQVVFEIDPCMVDDYDGYNFCLRGSDTTANVSFQSNGGNIQVGLSSEHRFQGGAGSAGAVNIASLPHHSWCYISVKRLTGDPCYTLSGDITVN